MKLLSLHKQNEKGEKLFREIEKLCQLTHFINSFSVSSSCFCLSITFSMIARSSGVRCDKSGISAMTTRTTRLNDAYSCLKFVFTVRFFPRLLTNCIRICTTKANTKGTATEGEILTRT